MLGTAMLNLEFARNVPVCITHELWSATEQVLEKGKERRL